MCPRFGLCCFLNPAVQLVPLKKDATLVQFGLVKSRNWLIFQQGPSSGEILNYKFDLPIENNFAVIMSRTKNHRVG